MLKYKPKVAQRIELRLLATLDSEPYFTYIEELKPEGLVIAIPMGGSEAVPLRSGVAVRLEYAYGDSGHVAFTTKVIGVDWGLIPTAMMAYPDPERVDLIQRRDFVRIDTSLPLVYRRIESNGRPADEPPVKSHTSDLSGSGAMVWSPVKLPLHSKVYVTFDFPGRKMGALCEVVRVVTPVVPLPKGGLWLGLRFDDIPELDRRYVIRYVFDVQRERRRLSLDE